MHLLAGQGPIFPKSFEGGSQAAEAVAATVPERAEWVDHGLFLRQELGIAPTSALASDAGIRIFHLYLPVCVCRYVCNMVYILPKQNSSRP